MPPAVAQAPIVTRRVECAADVLDPFGVVRRGDRAFDQREVVGALRRRALGRLGEIGDLDRAGDGEQLVLAVEQA